MGMITDSAKWMAPWQILRPHISLRAKHKQLAQRLISLGLTTVTKQWSNSFTVTRPRRALPFLAHKMRFYSHFNALTVKIKQQNPKHSRITDGMETLTTCKCNSTILWTQAKELATSGVRKTHTAELGQLSARWARASRPL